MKYLVLKPQTNMKENLVINSVHCKVCNTLEEATDYVEEFGGYIVETIVLGRKDSK